MPAAVPLCRSQPRAGQARLQGACRILTAGGCPPKVSSRAAPCCVPSAACRPSRERIARGPAFSCARARPTAACAERRIASRPQRPRWRASLRARPRPRRRGLAKPQTGASKPSGPRGPAPQAAKPPTLLGRPGPGPAARRAGPRRFLPHSGLPALAGPEPPAEPPRSRSTVIQPSHDPSVGAKRDACQSEPTSKFNFPRTAPRCCPA